MARKPGKIALLTDPRLIAQLLDSQPLRSYPLKRLLTYRAGGEVDYGVWAFTPRGKELPSALFCLRLRHPAVGKDTLPVGCFFGRVEGVARLARALKRGELPAEGAEEAELSRLHDASGLFVMRMPYELMPVLLAEGLSPGEEPGVAEMWWLSPEAYRPPKETLPVRPATLADAPFINEHWEIGSGEALPYVEACLRQGRGFVAEVEGRVVGFNLTHLDGTLGFLWVHPDYRRRGIAISLAHSLISAQFEAGLPVMVDVVKGNRASAALNLKLGFARLPWRHCWARLSFAPG